MPVSKFTIIGTLLLLEIQLEIEARPFHVHVTN